ncbi:MAG: hypothetical protein IPL61_10385 [Myxococcales bacterium]|nr:hypothetical protein [Myxococcales bacterium]
MPRLAVVLVLAAAAVAPAVAHARPASKGVFAEVGLGGGGALAAKSAWVQPGPALALRLGTDLFSWFSVGVAAGSSTHAATVPAPPEGEYVQLYRARADARVTARLNAIALYVEGGAGAAMLSSNVLAKVGVQDPDERFSLLVAGGGGFEYQLQNRHYALGLGGEYWLAPGFDALSGVEVRAFLRYTYGGAR